MAKEEAKTRILVKFEITEKEPDLKEGSRLALVYRAVKKAGPATVPEIREWLKEHLEGKEKMSAKDDCRGWVAKLRALRLVRKEKKETIAAAA